MNGTNSKHILLIVLVTLAAFSVIFFTPLRYSTIIEPEISDLEPEKVHSLLKENPENYLFIDVRPKSDYDKLHAEGSSNTPIQFLYDKWRELPKSGKEIILICSGGRLSGVAFFFLQHFGFTNIHRVAGGLEAWALKDLPVVLLERL